MRSSRIRKGISKMAGCFGRPRMVLTKAELVDLAVRRLRIRLDDCDIELYAGDAFELTYTLTINCPKEPQQHIAVGGDVPFVDYVDDPIHNYPYSEAEPCEWCGGTVPHCHSVPSLQAR